MSTIIASYAPEDASGISYVDNDECEAILQTFSMPAEFTIDRIDVKVCRLGTPGTVYATLHTFVEDPWQLGPAIVSPYFDGDVVTDDIDGEWVELTFGATALSAGIYALVMHCASASPANRIWWAGTNGDDYTNGDGYGYRPDYEVEFWWVNDNADYAFKAYGPVFTPPVGRPTTKRLIAAARNRLYYEVIE